ncbi:unnamed protein product [Trifolium pratense]|uniref:Uncharacterized protein n=1 Tax=Trifolium pratense TaxID=57577 RepID=A0ACB0L9R2_TRIPR|nr:unnamed protein product [Trifolium pratense]
MPPSTFKQIVPSSGRVQITRFLPERSLSKLLQDEMAKAVISNETSLSISYDDALVSKIKSEAAKAHTELLEANGIIPKCML